MKRLGKIIAGAGLLLALFGLTGCDWFVEALLSVEGDVVNAKQSGDKSDYWKSSSGTLEGATVKLYKVDASYNVSGDVYKSAEVDSTGGYSIPNVEDGRYKLTGSKSGWTFVPQIVDVTGFVSLMPTLIAYPEESTNTLTIIVSWENINYDVDLHAMVGDPSPGEVNYSNDQYETVTLDRDVTTPYNNGTDGDPTDKEIPRVETITVSSEPSKISPNEDPINSATIRFYVNSFGRFDSDGTSLTSALTGYEPDNIPSAYVTVYAMKGNEHYGTWELPYNTYENTLKVITMHFDDPGHYYLFTAGSEYDVTNDGSTTVIKSLDDGGQFGGTIGVGVDSIE
jgi:hypothetical protein